MLLPITFRSFIFFRLCSSKLWFFFCVRYPGCGGRNRDDGKRKGDSISEKAMGATHAREADARLSLAVPVHRMVGKRRLLDPSATECAACHSKFGFLRKKHYCRRCGAIVCDGCTTFRNYCSRILPNQLTAHQPAAAAVGGSKGRTGDDKPAQAAAPPSYRVCIRCNTVRSAVVVLPERSWRVIFEFAGPNAHHNALQSCRRLQLIPNLPFPDGSGWDTFFGESTFLAKGANGAVYRATLLPHMTAKLGLRPSMANGSTTVAVKVVNKNTVYSLRKWHHLVREVHAMDVCRHPHVLRLHGVFQSPDAVYMVIEYAAGGDLFDWFVSRKGCSELEVKALIRQLLTALQHMHDNCGAVHRDVKPENLLLTERCRSTTQIPKIVLGDFGFARVFPEAANPRQLSTAPAPVEAAVVAKLLEANHLLTAAATPCGTLGFAPPEVLAAFNARRAHPTVAAAAPVTPVMVMMKTDIFAAGITMSLLLTGMEPFPCTSSHANVVAVSQGINFDAPQWAHVSSAGRNLIKLMLAPNADQRPSAYDALKSAWFSVYPTKSLAAPRSQLPPPDSSETTPALIQQSIRSLRKNVGATYATLGQGVQRVTATELERADAQADVVDHQLGMTAAPAPAAASGAINNSMTSASMLHAHSFGAVGGQSRTPPTPRALHHRRGMPEESPNTQRRQHAAAETDPFDDDE